MSNTIAESPGAAVKTVRALSCANCGGTIALRAGGITVSLVCEHCGTTLDATDPALRIIAQANEAMARPEIPLGTRGEVRGTMWEVIGYLERSDSDVSWAEYLLFNPYRGYAFLVDDGRRFSLGVLMDHLPNHVSGAITVDEESYSRFGSTYGTWVQFVVGEFYWRVAVGEHVLVTDFVRPGTMLSCEENDSERTWTRLDLLDRGVAEKAFGLPIRPKSIGGTPAPHEPSPYDRLMIEALIIGAVAALTLILIALMAAGQRTVGGGEISVPLNGATITRVIGPIELADKSSAIGIRASVPQLDNSWIDLDYSLVDRRTQQSFDLYATAESYHGRDSDGPWREGDSTPGKRLSSIPRGSYDLVVEAAGHHWQQNVFAETTPIFGQSDTVPVSIEVRRGGIFFGNLLLALIMLLIWPAAIIFLHFGFEARRMAPVATSGDDE
jgi:hypothetical protein